jgi:nucleotide-binding universal stress UspA family protein
VPHHPPDRAVNDLAPIVVGTDGSETAQLAVHKAIALAAAVGGDLHVVSAYDREPDAELLEEQAEAPADVQWAVTPARAAEGAVAEAADAAAQAGVTVHSHRLQGDPAEALIRVAEEQHAALVVVGNRGMRGLQRFLLGSVPNKVSHHAPCSVLIVRTT